MKATLRDVVLGTHAGKKAMKKALKKSCEDQVKLLERASGVSMKKLKNTKTGEVGNLIGLCVESGKYELAIRLDGSEKQYFGTYLYDTFDEFRKEWEDA